MTSTLGEFLLFIMICLIVSTILNGLIFVVNVLLVPYSSVMTYRIAIKNFKIASITGYIMTFVIGGILKLKL